MTQKGEITTKKHVLAIVYKQWKKPCLMTKVRGEFYYELGPSFIGRLSADDYTIAKDYGMIDVPGQAWWHVLVQFARDFPPREGLEDSPGWLTEAGRFFPCRSWEHNSVADYVYRYVYGEVPGNAVRLVEKRWVRVNDTVTSVREVDLTQAQIDVLYDLYRMTTNDKLRRHLHFRLGQAGVALADIDETKNALTRPSKLLGKPK